MNMKQKIIIKESQLRKIVENKTIELDLKRISDKLMNIPCTGEGVIKLMKDILYSEGFSEVEVKFLGYEDDTNNLMYVIWTDKPMFVVTTKGSGNEKPCLTVVSVEPYKKII